MRFAAPTEPIRRMVSIVLCAVLLALGFRWFGEPTSLERFPCESCSCGCAGAAECWTRCCCYTLAERFAWARAHGVTPPWWLAPPENATEVQARPACCATHEASGGAVESSSGEPSARQVDHDSCKGKPKLAPAVALLLLTPLTRQGTLIILAPAQAMEGPRVASDAHGFPLGIDPPPPRA